MQVSVVNAENVRDKVALSDFVSESVRCKFVVGQIDDEYVVAVAVRNGNNEPRLHADIAEDLRATGCDLVGGGALFVSVGLKSPSRNVMMIGWVAPSMEERFGFCQPRDDIVASRLLNELEDALTMSLQQS